MKTMNLIAAGLLAASLLCGCSADEDADTEPGYTQISQEEARDMMNSDDSYIIADVRTADEFEESHIPGAINIPVEHLAGLADDLLPDREEIIMIYCRSGNRSKQAAEILAGMGYTNLYEFGGINTWPY
ncbi:MAG: rhodanese-like domain-containing protein, partial [Erysipelotrichaceae bacterium]|nr:rhodanese-like domain-containing protein [Erysipelotrichaceae bacterium]